MPDKILLGSAYPPLQDKVSDKEGILTPPWLDYFSRLPSTLASIPNRISSVTLSLRGASISSTDFSGTVLAVGLYRIAYYARITRAGSTSSTLTVSFGWTDGAVAQS